MSTSTWGESEPFVDETYPFALLKHFLKQMMAQFGAHGACMALYDEGTNQMKVQAHIRLQRPLHPSQPLQQSDPTEQKAPLQANRSTLSPEIHSPRSRRTTIDLLQEGQPSSNGHTHGLSFTPRVRANTHEEIEEVTPQQSGLFAVGTSYPLGHDLIGYIWQKKHILCVMRITSRSSRHCILSHFTSILHQLLTWLCLFVKQHWLRRCAVRSHALLYWA